MGRRYNTQLEKRSSMLFQLGLVELGPVVEIIQIDRIARSLGVVRQIRRSEDRASCFIIVVITGDGLVEFIDGSFVQRSSGLLTNPLFKLRISRSFLGNEGNDCVALQIEALI